MAPNLGGERSGGNGSQWAPGTTQFVAAVETTAEGKPVCLQLRRVSRFWPSSISGSAKRSLDPGGSVVSDGLQCFGSVAEAGCAHLIVNTGSGPKAAPAFRGSTLRWATSKAAITGNLSRHQQQARPGLEPLRSAIRPCSHDPPSHLGCRPNRANALSLPQIG
jgi:hypothetical protein